MAIVINIQMDVSFSFFLRLSILSPSICIHPYTSIHTFTLVFQGNFFVKAFLAPKAINQKKIIISQNWKQIKPKLNNP